jgi:hypothetical protein
LAGLVCEAEEAGFEFLEAAWLQAEVAAELPAFDLVADGREDAAQRGGGPVSGEEAGEDEDVAGGPVGEFADELQALAAEGLEFGECAQFGGVGEATGRARV